MFNVVAQEAAGNNTKHWAPLRRKYDIIGVDMRGTGFSSPIKCDNNTFAKLQLPMMKDEETYNETIALAAAFGKTCLNMTGPLLYHMGTDQAIEDYEMIRQAFGNEKFNYLGFSYGTQLGSEYADKYPDNVGRMVLDAVYNRHLVDEDRMTTGAVGVESVLGDFFRWCNTTTDCALYGQDQPAVFDWIIDTAAKGELRRIGCSDTFGCGDGSATPDWLISQLVQTSLHDGDTVFPNKTSNYQYLSAVLNFTYVERTGTAFVLQPDAETYPQIAITCSDRPERVLNVGDWRAIWTITPLLAPHYRGVGLLSQWLIICTGWPVKPLNPVRPFCPTRQKRLPPIMMVGAFYDPATASPWGLGMRALMPTAFTIYRNGSGHTSFGWQGDTAGAMTAFLVDGTRPEDGTVYQS